VPSESVSPQKAATVFGLCMGSCEILGGFGGPIIAGQLSEVFGRTAPLWLMIVLAVIGGITALFLRESAPRVLARNSLKPA
jgi:MFS transporter, ACS family, hexuronate transporter